MTQDIKELLRLHALWCAGEPAGRRANLSGAYLSGADLISADLSGADLISADLSGAYLSVADLRGAVLSSAILPEWIPKIPNIDATILAAIKQPGHCLDMERWHTCDTTHCRAGWAIHLAGGEGYELEKKVGADAAGALIYAASGSHPVPKWFAFNAEALADMERRAAAGTQP